MTVAQLITMLLGLTQAGVQVYGELNEDKKREAVIVSKILGQMFDMLPEWLELAKQAEDMDLSTDNLVMDAIEKLRGEVLAKRAETDDGS